MSKKPKKKKQPKKPAKSYREIDLSGHSDMMSRVSEALDKIASLGDSTNRPVSTSCPNCKLRLVIPKSEAYRCILCGHKELKISPYNS